MSIQWHSSGWSPHPQMRLPGEPVREEQQSENCQAEYNPLTGREWPQTSSSAGPTQSGRARLHAPSHTDLVQRHRPQLPPASLCVGATGRVCRLLGRMADRAWEGSLQRPTSDLRSKASSHVSGAVTAFPSSVPHRLSKRGGNREWSQATDWASKDGTRFLLATWLCPLVCPMSVLPRSSFPQVHEMRRIPSGPPSLPFSPSCMPTEVLVLEGRTGGTGGGGPAQGVHPRGTWPGPCRDGLHERLSCS